jgi:phosphatidylserine/phosphatidylglycerophosphate/cardiolipin synthase-like enzyme
MAGNRRGFRPFPAIGIYLFEQSVAVDQITAPADKKLSRSRPILREGRNCWRIAAAKRAAVLIDGADYFARLDQALRRAQKSIIILGWDFDAGIRLRPEDPASPRLGDFLRALVEERPDLEIRVLVWSVAILHAPGAPLPLLLGAPWEKHPRIHVKLDREHPIYGAHHQKIVCIDDTLAFVGGMDLTIRRWDTVKHEADHPLRKGPDGVPYPPVHDVQMLVEGEAALVASDVARERWRRAVRENVPPVTASGDLWPHDLAPDFTDTPVAVVRTFASWQKRPEITEGMTLTLDAFAAARRSIYLEAQYFTAPKVGDVLEYLLAQPEGPEIIVIVRRIFSGRLERLVMGGNQKRLVQRLRRADRYGRFGVYYPVVPKGDEDQSVTVHSKTVIVDDDFLRVGSSNIANRSTALDTELDLAIETDDPARQRVIAGLRDKLIGEHLDRTPQEVHDAVAAEGSLIRAIDKLNCHKRCLRRVPDLGDLPVRQVFGTWLLDPKRPFFLFPRQHGPDAAMLSSGDSKSR